MKHFSFFLSILVFFVSLYFFCDKLPYVITLDDMIYISLLGVLMAICITGIFINWEVTRVNKKRGNLVLFVNNRFSKKDKK